MTILDWIYAKAKLEGDSSREWEAAGNNDQKHYRAGMANACLEIADYIERNPECLSILPVLQELHAASEFATFDALGHDSHVARLRAAREAARVVLKEGEI